MNTAPAITTAVDTEATLAEFAFVRGHGDMLKHPADLDRYRRVIELTAPDLVIETGTWAGESAAWFAELGLDVVTVDIQTRLGARAALRNHHPRAVSRIRYVVGDSTHPAVIAEVAQHIPGRRVMVSLDSCHTREHVNAEIAAYGPMVSPGCYLVVEDGIFAYADQAIWRRHRFGDPAKGNPLEAIVDSLVDNPWWERDIEIEKMNRISHHPAGWWIKQP